jgi:hypothetical protein
MVLAMRAWGPGSEFFTVGARFCPAGITAAWLAVHAKLAGDAHAVRFYADRALAADRDALAARASGGELLRANVVGNAWSGWYEVITAHPSGW